MARALHVLCAVAWLDILDRKLGSPPHLVHEDFVKKAISVCCYKATAVDTTQNTSVCTGHHALWRGRRGRRPQSMCLGLVGSAGTACSSATCHRLKVLNHH
ncbi:hypothetical protein IF1G_01696 [Cordyceps javanica]|uniref:Uncharacterized protein n=1 Tax=Cordyceps javanica TaxID=43265 RepID=A0A545VCM4_9HYPO|nr:hypothetical protein IF1G_01696 [Cordyceps javanica]